MRVLGVDPGLDITGYGVIERDNAGEFRVIETGVVRTAQRDGIADRLAVIYNSLDHLIRETFPQAMVIEQLYAHYKHPSTAILMGHARGVVCLLSSRHRIKLVGYLPTRIKKAIVGKGHATKQQVQRMVGQTLRMEGVVMSADVSDALAIALSFFFIEEKKGYDLARKRKGAR